MENKTAWMVFKPEGVDVLYLWNGEFPSIIHKAPHEGDIKLWYWAGENPQKDLSYLDKSNLDSVLNSRQKIFKIPGNQRRYQVVSRGTYEYENPQ